MLLLPVPVHCPNPGNSLESGYAGLTLHGVAVTAIMEGYSVCQLQPDPGFSDENNYFKNVVAEKAHLDIWGKLPKDKLILADGTDVTEEVLAAEAIFTTGEDTVALRPVHRRLRISGNSTFVRIVLAGGGRASRPAPEVSRWPVWCQ